MFVFKFLIIIRFIILLASFIAVIIFGVLLFKALRKYLHSDPRGDIANGSANGSIGDIIKNHRVRCGMTQEFVAQSLGVSRQAVSKWETGTSAPSTSNLIALAKLFDIPAEELLQEC